MPEVSVVIEGTGDVAIVKRIVELRGCTIGTVYGRAGKAAIDASIGGYNNAARSTPWLVVRDQDSDALRPSELITRILPTPSRWMRFRIAVREMEAWLLADPETLSDYLQVSRVRVPAQPETLADPKGALVNMARHSRRAAIRADMVPEAGVSAVVGPGYVARVSEFAATRWRPEVARTNSRSLDRCMGRVTELAGYRVNERR